MIKTHLEIAGRTDDPVNKSEAITNAKDAVDDAERLMSQMLMLAKLDATSKQELATKTSNLTAIARSVCENFVLQLSNTKTSSIDLGFHADEEVWVLAEHTLVQEVVRNLVDNAVKHAGSDVQIDVFVDQSVEHGVLTVQDNGSGFAVSRNAQPNSEDSRPEDINSNGSGIGLTIVNEILNLISGTIEFSTAPPSGGTIARVCLLRSPAARNDQDSDSASPKSGSMPKALM